MGERVSERERVRVGRERVRMKRERERESEESIASFGYRPTTQYFMIHRASDLGNLSLNTCQHVYLVYKKTALKYRVSSGNIPRP